MFRRSLFAVALIALTAGCNGGAASPPPFYTGLFVPTPTPTPSPAPTATPVAAHLYVGNDNAAGGVLQFNLPLTATSTPNFSIASANVVSVALDATGNLAVGDNAGNLQFFTAPLSGASTPAAAFKNGTATNTGQIAFTAAGDFWASTVLDRVNAFTHPFSNASTPSASVFGASVGNGAPIGTAFDAAQNLYVAVAGFDTIILVCPSGHGTCSNIKVYAPPYTGSSTDTLPFANTAYRKIAVSSTQLFACSVSNPPGKVDVFNLPITGGASLPAFAITTGVNTPEAVALDAAGNLYVGNLADATVSVYAPPFSAASAPVLTLKVSTGAFAIFGIAIGK